MGNRKKSVFCSLVLLILSLAMMIGCTSVKPNTGVSDFDAELLEKYPEYCGLDASNGLDVYVWQMAAGLYSFGVLPHSETPRESISEELMGLMHLKGANKQEMRQILAAYNIDQSQIYIIPWQNPISSYMGAPWIVRDGEDPAQKLEDYVQSIEKMLFD